MLLAQKTKAVVIEHGEYAVHLAVTNSKHPPMVLEALHDGPPGFGADFADLVGKVKTTKSAAYLKASCSFSASDRFVRRLTLDAKRTKEPTYITEVASDVLRIEVDKNHIAVLGAFDGLDFNASNPAASKEVVFAGMPIVHATSQQTSLLGAGVYPESLELSSLNAVGALSDYLRYCESAKPTLMLELGSQCTHSYIVTNRGLEATRQIQVGLDSMVPVIQKELGLKDEESARKLFYSNTFDFTGMGALLCKRLLKELQSSMGFYEVQTGQSISQLICTSLPTKLAWMESVLAMQIGVGLLKPDFGAWLNARGIQLGANLGLPSCRSEHMAVLGMLLGPYKSTANHGEAVS